MGLKLARSKIKKQACSLARKGHGNGVKFTHTVLRIPTCTSEHRTRNLRSRVRCVTSILHQLRCYNLL